MPSISRILVPVDFSAPSEGAAQYAQSFARQVGCELTLLHVLEPVEFSSSPIELPPERLDQIMAGRSRAAQVELDHFASRELDAGAAKRLIVTGDPGEQILFRANSEGADLIVMPTHGFDPIRRFLLGSVAMKVLHGAESPVLTGVHFGEHPTVEFPPRHIVCGLDLGPHSARVLEWAWHLAQEFPARLTVVHVTAHIGVREQIASLLQDALAEAEVVVVDGDPHKALRDTVQRVDAGLLVIGRGASAEGPFGRLRAQAYAIVRSSPCPVLSV